MKKIVAIFIICMFIMSGFVSVSLSKNEDEKRTVSREVILQNKPYCIEKDGYVSIEYTGANGFLDEPGTPRLPIYQTVFEFSKDIKIYDVRLSFSRIITETVSSKVIPSLEPLPVLYSKSLRIISGIVENEVIYQSDELYPDTWFDYSIRCGLNDHGEDTTFVIVSVHTVRYQPLTHTIQYITDATIEITYDEQPSYVVSETLDSIDLLIIAPEIFVQPLQPLVQHKESINVKTMMKTIEDILSEFEGRDQPEQIKRFIQQAKEQYDITYVLLVGGLKSYIYAKDKDDRNHGSTNGWHVPVRYTNIRNGNEVGVLSDLYYSDLYRYDQETQQWEFEDWDSSGDGIFANSEIGAMDTLDLVPDVYIGRLACRTKSDVDIVVRKIISYESTSPDEKPWYNKMIGMAGRTFNLFDGSDQIQQTGSNSTVLSNTEWQEFEPRKEILERVEIKIHSLHPDSSNIRISLERPIGTILASVEMPVSEIPIGESGWVSFDFDHVIVEPYNKYYIVVSSDTDDAYVWNYADPLLPGRSRYALGNSSLGVDYDWCFKTFDLERGIQVPDGEYSVDTAFRYMESVIDEEIRVYWSNEASGGPVPETQDIIDAFNQGAGYINMEGHGNPLSWATHPVPDDAPFTGGLSITDFPQIKNGEKLPIVVVGGCHNALFNVSLIRTLIGRPYDNWYWTSGYITPICFCWALCVSPIGGAIASMGCTGLGLGGTPPDLEKSGGLDCNFFYQVGNGVSSLGEAHSGAIRKYIMENNVVIDEMFCIVEFHLFGDPSLQLGGST